MGFHLFPLSRDGRCGFPEVRELVLFFISRGYMPAHSLAHNFDRPEEGEGVAAFLR